MKVTLLGSGSADGWPNPFCCCASCQSQRGAGLRRVATSALIDDSLLLDFGPDTARQAESLGVDLVEVRTVLVTHAHPDHLAPDALLWRRWALRESADPVTVLGPATVTHEVQRWFADDPTVRTQTLSPGDQVDIAGYAVIAVPAAHEVETLLYDVTAPDGSRLLYATDTGPLPASALRLLEGRRYDVVLLEQTFGRRTDHLTLHLDLETFPRSLAALREVDAVGEHTRVLAVHLGHHNPPEAELAAVLGEWGAEAGRDGMRLLVAGQSDEPAASGTEQPERRGATRRILVVGGARSGKSSFAEAILADVAQVEYVATGGERADDTEWRARVATHQQRRPDGWTTTTTTDLAGLLANDGPPVLIDCLTMWLTAAMDDVGAWDENTWRSSGQALLTARVDELTAAWRHTRRRVVAVSNEVGGGVVPDTWSGRIFRDEMGRLNTRIAAESDRVHHVVAGLGTRLR